MSAPREAASGMVNVTSHANLEGRIECYGYGQDPRIPNPGDLLIVTTNSVRENHKTQEIEFALRIRGKHLHHFIKAAKEALLMYEDNRDWLEASASQPVRQESRSGLRAEDANNALKAFLANRAG
jgi:hypothetical protein